MKSIDNWDVPSSTQTQVSLAFVDKRAE